MIQFHSLCPEVAQREVRCVQVGPGPGLPADEYAYVEFYCEDLQCDCRRVFLQVMAKGQPEKVFASINYGWEEESFYQKRMAWDPTAARRVVRGELDPMNAQSEFAEDLLELFQRHVLDEPYRLRLRRHFRLFKDELARRESPAADGY
ncbi:MAG: hypothetical protein AAB676_00055 [Verrucomicrobiota bacterium]